MFDAVVLAGGGKEEPLTRQEGVTNKSFIDIHGQPMLGYILDALAGAASIGKVIVIGPEEELSGLLEQGSSFIPVPEEGGLLENTAAGLRAVDQERLCLVLTCLLYTSWKAKPVERSSTSSLLALKRG